MWVTIKLGKSSVCGLGTPEATEAIESFAVVKITNCHWQQQTTFLLLTFLNVVLRGLPQSETGTTGLKSLNKRDSKHY